MFRYSIVFLCAVLVLSNGYPAPRRHGGCYPGGRHDVYPINSCSHHIFHSYYYYTFNPPQQILYTSPHGGPAMSYPVYRGIPPTYVYQFKQSDSKYGTLLAGLALFNLGLGFDEVCLFGFKENNGDFEETRIDCMLISNLIYFEQAKQQNSQYPTIVSTVTNKAVVNTTNAQDTPVYDLSPNGTQVPPASVLPNAGNATSAPVTGGTVTSSVTTTSNNKTIVSALVVKGPAIQVTPGMQCYVVRRTPSSSVKHDVPCGLLQTYADESLKRNSITHNEPAFNITSKPFEDGTRGGDEDQGAAHN